MITWHGYASWFDEQDNLCDTVRKGAFTDTIAWYEARGSKLPIFWAHDQNSVIGYASHLREDSVGLQISMELFEEHAKVKELVQMREAGVLLGLSIGYRWTAATRSMSREHREILACHLIEVSVVLEPANTKCRLREDDFNNCDEEGIKL